MTNEILRLIILLSVLFYGSALVLYLVKRPNIGKISWILAEILSVTLVANNFIVNGYVPFVSMYQLLTFAAAMFGVVYLYIAYLRGERWTAPYFLGCSLVVSVGLCFMDITSVWHFPPALRSPWFVPHIFVYVLAYILSATAFAMTVTKIFVRHDTEKLRQLDGGIYDCVCVLFPCMTMGMLFGAIWANEVWGAFWGWDIKECWSLVTWLVFMTWLHVRRCPAFKKSGDVLIVLGFVCVIVTFFFVNGMNASANSLHTYN